MYCFNSDYTEGCHPAILEKLVAIYFERDGAFDPLAEPSERKIKGWKEEVLIQRQLGTKHYWIPFTTDDVTMYPEFYQNPGW